MKKIKSSYFLIVLFFALAGGVYIGVRSASAGTNITNEPKAEEIKEAIKHAYDVIGQAQRNGGDVSTFDHVFVDTADYRLENKEAFQLVARVYGKEAASHAGYLTAMKAKCHALGLGAKLYREAQQLAKRENREVTADELHQIQEASFGVIPPSYGETNTERKFTFEKIMIYSERAVVTYDDMAALSEAILIYKDGHWWIASIKPIQVHF